MKQQLGWCSLEQSKKLIEAGLDPNTADMFISTLLNKEEYFVNNRKLQQRGTAPWLEDGTEIPCWSLGRLIDLMPEIAMLDRDSTGKIPSYFMSIGPSESGEDIFLSEQYSTPIEAAVSTIIWLLENNYIKKGETK